MTAPSAMSGLAARFYDNVSPALRPGAAADPAAPLGAPLGAASFDTAFKLGDSGIGGAAAGSAGDRVRDVAVSFLDALREGEATATRGLAGQADAQSVVTALAASEFAVQTAVTLRDKVVEAYQEILRMPV